MPDVDTRTLVGCFERVLSLAAGVDLAPQNGRGGGGINMDVRFVACAHNERSRAHGHPSPAPPPSPTPCSCWRIVSLAQGAGSTQIFGTCSRFVFTVCTASKPYRAAQHSAYFFFLASTGGSALSAVMRLLRCRRSYMSADHHSGAESAVGRFVCVACGSVVQITGGLTLRPPSAHPRGW